MVFEQKFVPDFKGKLSGEIMRPGITKITVHTLVKVLALSESQYIVDVCKAGCNIYSNIFIFNGNSVNSDHQLNMNCRMYGKYPGMKIPTRVDTCMY